MDVDQFKRCLFNADNRNAGEKYAEAIVDGLLGMSRAADGSYDRFHANDRCEIKSTRILDERCGDDHRSLLDRAINFSTYERQRFCGNLQHIKLDGFDNLFYVAFFKDVVIIFAMTATELRGNAELLGHSRQGRGGTKNSDGQFSLRPANLQFHMQKFFKARLTYQEALHNFLLATSRKPHHYTGIAAGYIERTHHVNLDKLTLLTTTISQDRGRVVHDLALLCKVSQKAIHEFLNSPDGASFRSLVAVEHDDVLPQWALDPYGSKRPDVVIGTAREQKPQAALLVIEQPPHSGADPFDQVNEKTHGIDSALVNARTKKQKLDLVKDKEAAEVQKALVVARIHEKSDARGEIIDAVQTALDSAHAENATQKELLSMLRDENARLREEIASLRGIRRAA